MTQTSAPARPVNILNVKPFLFWIEPDLAPVRGGDVNDVNLCRAARGGPGRALITVTAGGPAWRSLNEWAEAREEKRELGARSLGIVARGRWVSLMGARVRWHVEIEPEFWIDFDEVRVIEAVADVADDVFNALHELENERRAARWARANRDR